MNKTTGSPNNHRGHRIQWKLSKAQRVEQEGNRNETAWHIATTLLCRGCKTSKFNESQWCMGYRMTGVKRSRNYTIVRHMAAERNRHSSERNRHSSGTHFKKKSSIYSGIQAWITSDETENEKKPTKEKNRISTVVEIFDAPEIPAMSIILRYRNIRGTANFRYVEYSDVLEYPMFFNGH